MKKVIIKRKVLSEQRKDLGGGNWVQSFEPTDTVPSARPADTQKDSASTTQKMVDDEGIKRVVRSALNKVINSKDFGTLVLQAANAAVKSMREEQDQDIIENFISQYDNQQIIEEEIASFVKENDLQRMPKEEALALIREGLLQNIASKLKMKPAQVALAVGLFLNSGAANAKTGIPPVDDAIEYIEDVMGKDVNQDGEIGSGTVSPEKSKEAENIRTFKSTAEAEKATGHKTTKAYKTQLAAANATSDMQNYDGATYRGVVKVGDFYHGLYTPFGTR